MASPIPTSGPVGPDTLITVKVSIDGSNRKFKLALRDLGAHVLPPKLRFLLAIPADADVHFERFSDSAGDYLTLDSNNPAIYKQLYRAAKAKLKLRLRVTVLRKTPHTDAAAVLETSAMPTPEDGQTRPASSSADTRQSFLETVLSQPPAPPSAVPSFKTFQCSRAVMAQLQQGPYATSHNATTETLVPEASSGKEHLLRNICRQNKTASLQFHESVAGAFSIDCNKCNKSIPNEHYHCSICEHGDFDLCQSCVDQGVTCDGEEHWLIKRSVKGGVVVPSITQKLAPRSAKPSECVETKAPVLKSVSSRYCNSCISEFAENALVTCKDCPDFDLCHSCFAGGEHGHHPAHTFQSVDDCFFVPPSIQALCGAGRGFTHEALCDGCNQTIVGVRHKCMSCPDWDYCSSCVLGAATIHPGHRFAPLYSPIGPMIVRPSCHYGIQCDGPLCRANLSKRYIRGDRYKCAVCDDFDLCASCEALPTNPHNKTHPLIKFKTPVRHVSVTTLGEDADGAKMTRMGDMPPRAKNAATETTPPPPSANAATQVQTVAEVKPAESATLTVKPANAELQAEFESDSTPDGTRFPPNRLVSQSWTLRNPGPHAWPAGCAVYFVGGDDMRNLDIKHPSSVSSMTTANRSNVIEHAVEPGQTAVFQVVLKSPAREGRVISYWRMKTPEGVPFGHKLWVDITVAASPADSPSPASATVVASETPVVAPPADEPKAVHGSTMIFPKLEKESPASSIHELADVPAVSVEPTTTREEQELLEDIESLELDDEDTDDGFMTDEEYDILDASDEDFLMEAQRALRQ